MSQSLSKARQRDYVCSHPIGRILPLALQTSKRLFFTVSKLEPQGIHLEVPHPTKVDAGCYGLGRRRVDMHSFFGPGVAAPDFVGRTERLQEDLDRVLLRLGYAPRNLTQYHCVSACDEHHTDGLVDASDPSLRKAVARFRYLDYYDAETAACVEQLYHRDFEQFGFAPFAQRDGASSSPVVRCCGPHPCAPAHKRPP